MDIKYILNCGLRVFTDKDYRFYTLAKYGVYNNMPDEEYVKRIFKARMGKELDLQNPKTFNEKLQWLKLYNRDPLYTKMVDKYEAKKYIGGIIGEEHIIPTIGVWDRFDDIDFDKLPDQFVLKCTHDSGGLVICKDKAKLDKAKAKRTIERALRKNYYYLWREWPYKDVKPRIIAEEYMSNLSGSETVEYKIFCFGGKARIVLVCKGTAHGSGRTNDYCDLELNRYPFESLNPNSKGELTVPEQLPEMIEIAETLSGGIPQVRVDMYLFDEKVYIGEMTFFHNAGAVEFEPSDWDETLGSWIDLPEKSD